MVFRTARTSLRAVPARGWQVARRWLPWLLGVAMVAPPIVAVLALAFRTWHPTDDLAIVDLRVRDVFTSHPSLTGLFSRPGWNHPGPAMFWLIALVARPFGNPTWATRAGNALVEAGLIAWLAVATARAGLRYVLAAAAVTGLLYVAILSTIIREPWNLNLPLIGFVLVLFLAVLVATGHVAHVIGLAIAASIVVQTHIGFALPVAAAIVFALVCVALDIRRHGPPPKWRSIALVTVAATVLLWLPPIVDLLVNWPGNLGKIVKYFAAGDYAHVGMSSATGIFASEFKWLPPWLGGREHLASFSIFAKTSARAWLLIPVALLVAGAAAAWRTRRSVDRRCVALAATLFVATILAISRADEPRAYTFEWRVVVAAYIVVVCVQALVAWLPHPQTAQYVAGALAVAIAVWGAVDLSVRIVEGGASPLQTRARALAAMLPALDRAPHDRVLVRPAGNTLHGLFDGVVNELDRRGVDVRVDPRQGRIFGGNRRGLPAGVDEVWYVSEVGSPVPGLLREPGARLVASTSPLSHAENEELDRLQTRVREQLRKAGRAGLSQHLDRSLFALIVGSVPGVDQNAARRISALNALVDRSGGCRCAIVAVPGGRSTR